MRRCADAGYKAAGPLSLPGVPLQLFYAHLFNISSLKVRRHHRQRQRRGCPIIATLDKHFFFVLGPVLGLDLIKAPSAVIV